MPVSVYEKFTGELSFNDRENQRAFNAYPVGIVLYEWIEFVDLRGDEYGGMPVFFCHFKGKTNWHFWKKLLFFGYPYKRAVYYKLSEVYHERNDPQKMKYNLINEPITK